MRDRKYPENTRKDWPAGSRLVTETETVNNVGVLASIGLKYNQRKVLFFWLRRVLDIRNQGRYIRGLLER